MRLIKKIASKYKVHGIKWIFQRIFRELCAPKNFLMEVLAKIAKFFLYWGVIKPIDRKLANKLLSALTVNDALLLIYDLSVEPVTYNFIFPLVIAGYQAQKKKLPYVDVLLIKGDHHNLREEEADYEASCSVQARHWRVQSILFGSMHLLPNFRHLFYVNQQEARDYLQRYPHRYPKYYTLTAPVVYFPREVLVSDPRIRCLRADEQSLHMMHQWLNIRSRGRSVITITLRQSSYCPDRNSHIAQWLDFAKSLDASKYYVVFVPDTETYASYLQSCLDGFDCCTEACISVLLRMALYELSLLCLGINNGPMSLCWFNEKCNYRMFKIVTESVAQTTQKVLLQNGLVFGKNPAFAREKDQLWVWCDDESSVINSMVSQFLSEKKEASLVELNL